MDSDVPIYDRQLLLHGSKRNHVLDLEEVRRYGTESYGDPDYVSIYGFAPADWYGRGIRLLGRTAVECTRDRLADAMSRDLAAVAALAPAASESMVLDPFVGSGNTLYWILRRLQGARGLGCELDPHVYELTRANLSILGQAIDVVHEDYVAAIRGVSLPADQLLVAFIAPPWGLALKDDGLDLRLTSPPIGEVIDVLAGRFPNRALFGVQVYERISAASLEELEARFDWSRLAVYDFNVPGQNHGLLLGTRGWRPAPL